LNFNGRFITGYYLNFKNLRFSKISGQNGLRPRIKPQWLVQKYSLFIVVTGPVQSDSQHRDGF
jgi:hypothetical protein